MFESSLLNRRRRQPGAKVMLTSMMDMFTIILVFLLYNFSTEDQNLTIPKDVELPVSSSEIRYKEAVNVVVSQEAISVGDRIVARIRNGQIRGSKVEGKKIFALYRELRRQRAILEYRTEKDKLSKKDSENVVLFQADKRVSYEIVDMVLKTSGMAGFPKFRFAVFRRES